MEFLYYLTDKKWVQNRYWNGTRPAHFFPICKLLLKWLENSTVPNDIKNREWRSTRTIASYNNMTKKRVIYICSITKEIAHSTGKNEDLWGVDKRVGPNYDDFDETNK